MYESTNELSRDSVNAVSIGFQLDVHAEFVHSSGPAAQS